MHMHIDDVPAVEIAPGVVERVLMEPDNPLARVKERHHALTKGGTMVFNEPMTEFQHYMVSGCALMGNRIVPQDTGTLCPLGHIIQSIRHAAYADTALPT